MAKVKVTNNAYKIFEDIIVLAGGIARLGKSFAAQKIQSSADAASNFVSDAVDMNNINNQLSGAKDGLVQASDYALNTDVSKMVEDATAFARRNPITTLVSVVAVGTLISHFLRSGEESQVRPAVKRAESRGRKPRAKSSRSAAKTPTRAAVKAGPRATAHNGSGKANGAARTHA
jgi:hypothetical protein